MTTGEWVRLAEARLAAAGIQESARTEARGLAAYVLGVSTAAVLAHPEGEFPELAGEVALLRREAREPLAYILGRREFYGREFAVGPGVLVPRHETETLVEVALNLSLPGEARVLDVGTGSGCVGITLALERPTWKIAGIDLSPDALRYAEENGESLGASVEWVQGDLLPIRGEFDLVVSNPPYIDRDEPLPPEVAAYEPGLALFAEDHGLAVYRRLAREAPGRVAAGGWIVLEIGYRQAAAVTVIFREAGWSEVATTRDLSGIERVVAAQKPNGSSVIL